MASPTSLPNAINSTSSTSNAPIVTSTSFSPSNRSLQEDDDEVSQDVTIAEIAKRLHLSEPAPNMRERFDQFVTLMQVRIEGFQNLDQSSFSAVTQLTASVQQTVLAQNAIITDRLLSEKQRSILVDLAKAMDLKVPNRAEMSLTDFCSACLKKYKSGGWTKTKNVSCTLGEAFFRSTQLKGEEDFLIGSFNSDTFEQKSEMGQITQFSHELGLVSPFPCFFEEMRNLTFAEAYKSWEIIKEKFQELKVRLGLEFEVTNDLFESKNNCFKVVYDALSTLKDEQLIAERRILQKLTDRFGRTLIMCAVGEEKYERAIRLARLNIALHGRNENHDSVLHVTCRSMRPNVAVSKDSIEGKLLTSLWENCNVNDLNDSQETPLHVSIHTGNNHVTAFLLDVGASFQLLCPYRGFSLAALPLTVALNAYDRFKLILKKAQQKDPNVIFTLTGGSNNILHIAVLFSSSDFVSKLVDDNELKEVLKILLEQQNEQELTPFNLASARGEIEILEHLSKCGAKRDATDRLRRGPVHFAAVNLRHQALRTLRRLECNFEAVDIYAANAVTLLESKKYQYSRGQLNEFNSVLNLTRNLILNPTYPLEPLIPRYLAFKGGGIKGIAYVGVVEYLNEKGYLKEIKAVAGTSAGSITAALLAVGCSYEYIDKELMSTDFLSFIDDIFTKKLEEFVDTLTSGPFGAVKALKEIVSIAKSIQDPITVFNMLCSFTGLCEGEAIRKYIERIIKENTGIDHCTFGELRAKIGGNNSYRHLHVYATLLGANPQIAHFSTENPRWANLIISDAVRASMSIPGVFKPHILHFKDPQGNRYPMPHLGSYADGGMIYNLPIEAFDQRRNPNTGEMAEADSMPVYNEHTIGFNLMNEPVEVSPNKNVTTLKDLIFDALRVYYKAERLIRSLNPYTNKRIVNINVGKISTLNFAIDSEQKKTLAEAGKKAMEGFFKPQGEEGPQATATNLENAQLPMKLNGINHVDETTLQALRDINSNRGDLIANGVLGGSSSVGKSEAALQFAYEQAHAFSLVWWIPCSSKLQKERAYRELAQKLKVFIDTEPLEQVVKAVHRKLAEATKPWLLILDDAREGSVELPLKGGTVVVTTRNENLQFSCEGNKHPSASKLIKVVTSPSSAPTFLRAAGFKDDLMQQVPQNWTYEDCIRFRNLNLQSFTDLTPNKLMEMSLEALKKENAHAYEFLLLFAFLSPYRIDIRIVSRWTTRLPNVNPSAIVDILIQKEFFREIIAGQQFAIKSDVLDYLRTHLFNDLASREQQYKIAFTFLAEFATNGNANLEDAPTRGEVVAQNLDELRKEVALWKNCDNKAKGALLVASALWKLSVKTDLPGAKEELTSAFELCPELNDDHQTTYEFGLCLSDLNAFAEAIPLLVRSLSLLPPNARNGKETDYVQTAVVLARCHCSLRGEAAKAIPILEAALEFAKNEAKIPRELIWKVYDLLIKAQQSRLPSAEARKAILDTCTSFKDDVVLANREEDKLEKLRCTLLTKYFKVLFKQESVLVKGIFSSTVDEEFQKTQPTLLKVKTSNEEQTLEVAHLLCLIGDIYLLENSWEHALEAYNAALSRRKTLLPYNHVLIVDLLCKIALTYYKKGPSSIDTKKAINSLKDAYERSNGSLQRKANIGILLLRFYVRLMRQLPEKDSDYRPAMQTSKEIRKAIKDDLEKISKWTALAFHAYQAILEDASKNKEESGTFLRAVIRLATKDEYLNFEEDESNQAVGAYGNFAYALLEVSNLLCKTQTKKDSLPDDVAMVVLRLFKKTFEIFFFLEDKESFKEALASLKSNSPKNNPNFKELLTSSQEKYNTMT